MRSGTLNERVAFQTMTQVSDGMGSAGTETWSDTVTGVPAAFWPLNATEAIENEKLTHRIDWRVRTRFDSRIKAGMRIKWVDRFTNSTHYLDILSMRNLGGKYHEIEIFATELDL
jgi:SPP1 family predicted phage head-tail adaptor